MTNLDGTSTDKDVPGVSGENTSGVGIWGTSNTGTGVVGKSDSGVAVYGESQSSSAVAGASDSGIGVHGVSHKVGPGVRGDSDNGVGVFGGSKTSSGVGGMTESGIGVHGVAKSGIGVRGDSDTFQGVFGHSNGQAGVVGESNIFHAVYGISHDHNSGGIFGTNDASGFGVIGISDSGVGISGKGGRLAGLFEGDVEVTGKINPGHINCSGDITAKGNVKVDKDIFLTNADCAEDFNIGLEAAVEPGTVMVLGEEGALFPSQSAYDKCVAGVVSGAGEYKPGIVLDKRESERNRQPIALLGKVYCKVDAQYGAIEIGDLLTTSPTLGHAMKVDDPAKALGAMIGKALRPLKDGQDLIPILIALQ